MQKFNFPQLQALPTRTEDPGSAAPLTAGFMWHATHHMW